jgi:hypothetical protein
MNEYYDGPVTYLEQSESAVYFSRESVTAGTFQANSQKNGSADSTAIIIRKLQSQIDLAYWGEDNRFPQNIVRQMAYCGIGQYGLDRKARKLWGNGIIPGKITGYDANGTEIFVPLKPQKNSPVYKYFNDRKTLRFWLEYLQDWAWFSNCFPEAILSKDCKTITHFAHQESCDSRFRQMNDAGKIEYMFLSKIWGLSRDQFATFDPDKAMKGLYTNQENFSEIDNKYIKKLDCIDMYDSVNSLKEIAKKLKSKSGLKSAILPVNYPSPNKTYYQVPVWDGARLGGWVEIACKVPSLIKTLYNKAFKIKNHIEIPSSYFPERFGEEAWAAMKDDEKIRKKKDVLKEMDEFLSGDKNAFKTFVSIFQVDNITKNEYARIKITPIEDKANIDNDIITGSAADTQILIAMGQNPTISGAGKAGSGQQRSGGSDIREGDLVETSVLNLERNVFMEPLYLMRDFNREVGGISEWSEDLVFRVRDTVLTTLDTGAGTKKVVS